MGGGADDLVGVVVGVGAAVGVAVDVDAVVGVGAATAGEEGVEEGVGARCVLCSLSSWYSLSGETARTTLALVMCLEPVGWQHINANIAFSKFSHCEDHTAPKIIS